MKRILIPALFVVAAFGAQAQSVTYNHDDSKMNQITVGETGAGTLTPEAYYMLLHNKYRKTAASKNKLGYRTTAAAASFQQVDMAESIDSSLTSRAEIEALNVADREIDIAWAVEKENVQSQMDRFKNNIDRIIRSGGTIAERNRWVEYYNVFQCAIDETRDAYMPNAQRKKEYLQIYKDIAGQNEILLKYLVQLNSRSTATELLAAENSYAVDKKGIASDAMSRWKQSCSAGGTSQGGSGSYAGEETVIR